MSLRASGLKEAMALRRLKSSRDIEPGHLGVQIWERQRHIRRSCLSLSCALCWVRGHRLPHASTCHTTLVEEARCSQQRAGRAIKHLPVPWPRQTRLPALQRAAAARATPDAPLASPTLAEDSRTDCTRDGKGSNVIQVSL
jgi:hypothetical protein